MVKTKGKRESLLGLRRLPKVIDMYAGLKKGGMSNPPEYFAGHLEYWLRLYAVPGVSSESYPDGRLLSRECTKVLDHSLMDIFGNFAFVSVSSTQEETQEVAKALNTASHIFWDKPDSQHSDKFHNMVVLDDPVNYKPLHDCFLELLGGSDGGVGADKIERIAEYFVLFCQHSRRTLKELAMLYSSAEEREATHRRYAMGDD